MDVNATVADMGESGRVTVSSHADISDSAERPGLLLSAMTTLRLGGPARQVRVARTDAELIEIVTGLDREHKPVLLVGGGSNLVVADEGFEGTVVRVNNDWIEFGVSGDRPYVTAGAGVGWDALVAATVDEGYGGLECLSGIPGAAGATPVQNVGAYGVDTADVLRCARILDPATGRLSWVYPDELEFGYRTSRLKRTGVGVVVAVSFWLTPGLISAPIRYHELASRLGVSDGAVADARDVRDAVLTLRRGKGMVLDPDDYDTWSAGSFFTNPVIPADRVKAIIGAIQVAVQGPVPRYPAAGGVKLSAAWLIDRAGFSKGHPGVSSPVRLSTKHTLALTNRGSGTTAQLLELARDVRDGVRESFGVELVCEPILVNCRL